MPQKARLPPAKRPTVPAGTGLAAVVIAAQPVFSCVGSGVAAAIFDAHFVVARAVTVVTLGSLGSPADQVPLMSPYSSARSNAEWHSSCRPISSADAASENQADDSPAPPYRVELTMTMRADTTGTAAWAVAIAMASEP